MIFILILSFSALLTTVMVPAAMKAGHLLGAVDVPGSRRVHSGAIPRTGGLAIAVGALVPLVLLAKMEPYIPGICLGAACILAVGLLDDLLDLDFRLKFLGQTGAAVVFLGASGLRLAVPGALWSGAWLPHALASFFLSLSFMVATINAVNLADGLDGLAAGICLLIFTSVSFPAYTQNNSGALAVSVCMIGASIGFLRFNTYPAVVFMGDTGSQLLGYMVGAAMMLFTRPQIGNSSVLVLYFIGIPVLDTAMVILHRLIEHQPLFKPDMNHIHHKLLKLGFRHSHAVVVIYATQLGMILLGWTMRRSSALHLLAAYVVIMSVFLALLLLCPFGRIAAGNAPETAPAGERNVQSTRRQLRLLISRAAWAGMTTALLVFYFYSPLLGRPIDKNMGVYSLGLAGIIFLIKIINKNIPDGIMRIAAYFLAVYYIVLFDIANKTIILWYYGHRYSMIIYILLGLSYIVYLITTYDDVPIVAMDYLLLAVVVMTFFLPVSLLTIYHVNTITIKVLITFLGFELIRFKLGDRSNYLAAGLISALCLNFIMAFWPWII
jgi:UDP-GlcNAc:undecaprenyl-phosphate GlcNAc-1-phosphate transferase